MHVYILILITTEKCSCSNCTDRWANMLASFERRSLIPGDTRNKNVLCMNYLGTFLCNHKQQRFCILYSVICLRDFRTLSVISPRPHSVSRLGFPTMFLYF